ncbi:MAG TPA: sugar ABC transporter permease [Candidatus Limnocylindria bacterium]|nr:sugar ABC transporter permease [Candidatus Limnocylindria bacterium]
MDLGTGVLAVIVVVGVPAITVLYALATEWVLRIFPEGRRAKIRPWLWLLPGFAFLGIFLIYPTVYTVILSLMDRRSENFVGLQNYVDLIGQQTESGWEFNRNFWQTITNTALWLLFYTVITVVIGLLIAVMTDRVRYETAVKALIFIPMAISFVAAGVIWGFMYDFNPDIGTLNAGMVALGGEPQAWLFEWPRNTFMLIVVGIWMWVGFSMVILSAGLKGISTELLEAARMDGANELQVFIRIILPLLAPTIAVVGTTIVIVALKTFDIVWVMTGGQFGSEVIGTLFYNERFTNRDAGAASAVAVILLLTIIPVMLVNVRRFRAQEAAR